MKGLCTIWTGIRRIHMNVKFQLEKWKLGAENENLGAKKKSLKLLFLIPIMGSPIKQTVKAHPPSRST